MAAFEAIGEQAPILQQVESEERVCSAVAAAPTAAQAPARRRRSHALAKLAAGLAAGALLACCYYAVPLAPGSSAGEPARPELGDLDGVTELAEDMDAAMVDAVRNALGGPPPAGHVVYRYVVFRCRDNDYAGGFGDRIAGLLGAAYFAMSTGRQLKVDWPELFQVFQQNLLDLNYDPDELGISAADQEFLNTHYISNVPNVPDGTFGSFSQDVVVFNAWDDDSKYKYGQHWRDYPSDVSESTKDYRIIVTSGNRAGTEAWFATLQGTGVLPASASFWELYHVLFGTMLAMNPAFTQRKVSLQVATDGAVHSATQTMEDTVGILKMPDVFSIGVHIRAGDEAIKGEANLDAQGPAVCDGVAPIEDYMPHITCMQELANQRTEAGTKLVLVIFSDSRCVKRRVMDHFGTSSTFHAIWSQEISGAVNIDSTLQTDEEDAQHAWEQSMVDWLLMRQMDVLAIATSYTFISGFPASSLITTSVDKELYSLASCKKMPKTSICASRFC